MRRRALSVVICLLMIVSSMLLCFASTAETTTAGNAANLEVFSEIRGVFQSFGYTSGDASAHGNNQTRLVHAESGIYLAAPMESCTHYNEYAKQDQDAMAYGMWKINDDNTAELLVKDYVFYWGAGGTCNAMVDNNGDIWCISSWCEGSGFYPLIAWQYDVSEKKTIKYEEAGYYARGGGYGKPNAIMDAVYNRIYLVVLGGEKESGYLTWAVFDIETKTWTKTMYQVKGVPCAYYHYCYATGKGGFVMCTERTLLQEDAFSDIAGMRVSEGMKKFHSNYRGETGQVWDSAMLMYVPDATVKEAYWRYIIPAEYDIANGCIPEVQNHQNDVFYDKETGYLYDLVQIRDNGTAGIKNYLIVFDTKHFEGEIDEETIFPIICKKEIEFLYGKGTSVAKAMYKDTEGNLYIIAAAEKVGQMEIWQITEQTNFTLQLVYEQKLVSQKKMVGTSLWNALISATERNNSIVSDKGDFILNSPETWSYFTVNFANLRQLLNK